MEVIKKHFPDNRRILNELQRFAKNGKIDDTVLVSLDKMNIDSLVEAMKELKACAKITNSFERDTKQQEKFSEIRKWTADNMNNDVTSLFRSLYDNLSVKLESGNSVALMIQQIADYQYKAAFVYDQEINFMACLVDILAYCDFRKD